MSQGAALLPSFLAAGFLAALAAAIAGRIGYPFELEWLEGGMLAHVHRLLHGEPLYTPPSADWIPFVYPPLYPLVGAFASRIGGTGLPTLRAVSITATAAALCLVFFFAARETGRPRAGLLAAGFFAACYPWSGAWLDVARPDALALALVLAGFVSLRCSRSLASGAAAGVCLGLSVLAKQTASIAALPALAAAAAALPRRGLLATGVFLGVVAAAFGTLHFATGGWSSFYVWVVPASHAIERAQWVRFWTQDVLPRFTIPLALLGLRALLPPAELGTPERRVEFGIALGLLAWSWSGRLNRGGGANALLPACALFCVVYGLETNRLAQLLGRSAPSDRTLALTALLQTLPLAVLLYDPRLHLPKPEIRRAGEELLRLVRSIPGEVHLPLHPEIAVLAGKRPFAYRVALQELEGEFGGPARPEAEFVRKAFEEALRSGRFAAVVAHRGMRFREALEGAYRPVREVDLPILGKELRRAVLYAREEASTAPREAP
jgi:hypothetical protein